MLKAHSLKAVGLDQVMETKETFSRFDASFRTISSGSSRKDIPASKVSIFYLRDAEPNAEFESILKAFKGHKTSFVVLYTPHHSSDFAFRMGKIVGKHSLETADWAFNLRHLEQLLLARNIVAHRAHKTAERFDIVAARKRLGLTQEQMASALNVTTRTLQNWEGGLGTSQMPKKTQDLRELLGLMDDYVVAPKEREWLQTSLPAVQNRRPTDVISSCLVPEIDGAYFSERQREALWDRYFTGAPVRLRQSVERYNIVKRA